MRSLLLGVLLSVCFVTAGLASANVQGGESGEYVAGSFAPATDIRVKALGFAEQASVGGITVDVSGWEKLSVEVQDEVAPDVKVYYSFHPEDEPRVGVLGEPLDAVGVGIFCSSAQLDVPEGANTLRLSLNAPSSMDADACPAGVATTGTWVVEDETPEPA